MDYMIYNLPGPIFGLMVYIIGFGIVLGVGWLWARDSKKKKDK